MEAHQLKQATQSGRRTALVVEDDPDLRGMVRRLLEHMGLDVAEVAEGRAAILHLAVHRPDLVCLDLMLPELSGYEVAEFMRTEERLLGVPILIMSARSMPQDRAFAEQVGASTYLVKPFKHQAFKAAVQALLGSGVAEGAHR